MSLELSDDDRSALAAEVARELETGRYGERFVLSRRQLLSIAGGAAGVAGLTALGVDPATAQQAAGQVGTESDPVDVYAAGGGTVELEGDVTSTSVTGGYEITIDGDTYELSTQ